MDPLSIIASVIAVAGVAAKTGSAFTDLRRLCKTLPGRLHALSNEVNDLELVLYQVAAVIKKRVGLQEHGHIDISHQLHHAQDKLEELRAIIEKLTEISQHTNVSIFGAHAWRRDRPKLQALQEEIRNVKIEDWLIYQNSQDMMRIRVDLQSLSVIGSQSIEGQDAMREDLHTSLVRHHNDLGILMQMYAQVNGRIGTVEGLLRAQASQLERNQFKQMGNNYGDPSTYIRQNRPPRRRSTQHPVDSNPQDIGIRVAQYNACRSGCPCNCHVQARSSTPGLIDRVFGKIFVGYAGLPLLSPKCNTTSCEKAQAAHISLEYWFPLGFVWSQIVRFRLTYESNVGPHFELSSLRRVPDSAQCVNFALNGDIDGLKDLFRRGLASPRDVSTTRGYSVLRWAMYGKQYQTCRFLLHAGADPNYRPVAASDNSPRNKAHQFLLMGGLSAEDVEALRCLTQGSDFIEEQNYTLLHRIVLGLSLEDLEEGIFRCPEDINTPDAMGRTPLAWAACRGDEKAIVILLQNGARVNTLDVQCSGVVGHAADRSYVTCVRLLLEAGAYPDIAAAHGHKVGNPLNVAARNASDPMVLKTLLDFGADVESSGVDGNTALIHASRRDNASFATLLLEYGANINATSAAGLTPLTTAVTFNSHNVLQLLLDRWFEYSQCPRLTGPHLLQIVALYADAKTMAILTATDHLKLKYDQNYSLGDFISILNERPDATPKLAQALSELLAVIKQGPEVPHPDETRLEAGLRTNEKTTLDEGDPDGSFENWSLP
ncbi:MAG: hypothetical protein Q9163_003550 [Psora crenata]